MTARPKPCVEHRTPSRRHHGGRTQLHRFDDLWNTVLGGPSAGQALEAMSEEERTRFRELLQARLQPSGAQCQAFDASA